MIFRPQPPAGAEFRHLLEQIAENVEVERQPAGELVDVEAARQRRVGIGLGDGEGVTHFLGRRRAGFADVIAADAHRRIFRRHLGAILDGVGDEFYRRIDREHPGAAADELFQNIVLRGAAKFCDVVAALLRHGEIHGDQDGGGAVDGERNRDGVEIDAVEGDFEIAQGIDRHADPADFADRFRRVGIVAALRRQIEGDVEPGLAVGDQIFEALVGVGGVGEAGILPHGERPLPVHQRMNAAGERRLAGAAGIDAAGGDHILGGIERFDLDAGFVDHAADGSFLARRLSASVGLSVISHSPE